MVAILKPNAIIITKINGNNLHTRDGRIVINFYDWKTDYFLPVGIFH